MREYTAGEITDHAIKFLTAFGYKCWRNNNLAVKGRKFTGQKGVGDISGYKLHTGQRLECEVKKKGDTIKKEQREFLTEAKANNCHVYLATQKGEEIVIEKFDAA